MNGESSNPSMSQFYRGVFRSHNLRESSHLKQRTERNGVERTEKMVDATQCGHYILNSKFPDFYKDVFRPKYRLFPSPSGKTFMMQRNSILRNEGRKATIANECKGRYSTSRNRCFSPCHVYNFS